MCRPAHNHARTVIQEYVICKVQRNFFAAERIYHICSGKDTFFFGIGCRTYNFALCLNSFHKFTTVRLIFRSRYKLVNNRVFGRDNHIRNTIDCVGTGCINGEGFIRSVYLKFKLCALASAYPVRLHRLNLIGPAAELIYIIQKSLRIIGNLKEPLFKVFLSDLALTAFALSVYDLFVRKHRLTGRTPVHIWFLFICKSVLIQLKEHPLSKFIVFGFCRCDLSVPVIAESETL